MRVVLQRVASAAVKIGGNVHSEIERGMVILLGIEKGDNERAVELLVQKVVGLRIFDDSEGKMNLSIEKVQGHYLVVSQFTLCADLSKGKRPGFENAMAPAEARRLYEFFCARLQTTSGRDVKTGVFGETMLVEICNEGPVTFVVEATGTQ